MLRIAALIILGFMSFRVDRQLASSRRSFVDYGISERSCHILRASVWLYIAALAIWASYHGYLFVLSFPVPVVAVLFLPGVIQGRSISKRLKSGDDIAVRAGRIASNAMWLGVGGLIFVLGPLLYMLFVFEILLSFA